MIQIPLLNILAGFLLAAVIALAAWRARSLSEGGALAALLLGTVIFGLGGLGWAVLLLAFFISSSVLSRLFRRRKAALDEKFSKGSRRDAGQVLANGGIAGLFVLVHIFTGGAAWTWLAFAGALAAANADTWATELGVLSKVPPRLITTGRVVERGESGGISLAGTLAALSGALLIGLFAALLWQGAVTASLPGHTPAWLAYALQPHQPGQMAASFQAVISLPIVALAGLIGSLVDSLLGATVQAIYTCPTCKKHTERHPLHTCGTRTRLARGLAWMDNDWVNAICTLVGALLAAGLWLLLAPLG